MAKKQSKRKRWIIISIIIVVLAGVVSAFVFGKRDNAVEVTVEKVSRRTITQTVSATGKIQPETLVKISSEASGEIIYLGAEEGDTVKKGQLLVRIQPDLVNTQLQQAQAAAQSVQANINTVKADLNRFKADYERVKGLYDKEFASKAELDAAEAAYKAAQARYEAAQRDYDRSFAGVRQSSVAASRTTITAPMTGIVVSRAVKTGEKVVGVAQMQGTELMQIADLSVMNAEVDVDENDVVLISVGDTARVRIDAFPGKIFRGYVYQIGNSAKRGAVGTQDEVVNFTIKIRLIDTEPRLRPGMSCDVDIETETRPNALAVPLQAVTLRRDKQDDASSSPQTGPPVEQNTKAADKSSRDSKKPQQIVFVSDAGKAKAVPVETGISDKGYIEVKSGLNEGQTIVSGSFRAISKELEDGTAIKIDTLSRKTKKKN
jgi:HlyD family secretion protein